MVSADELVAKLDGAIYLPPSVEAVLREAYENDARKTAQLVEALLRDAGRLHNPAAYLRKQLAEIVAAGPRLRLVGDSADEPRPEPEYVRPTAGSIVAAFEAYAAEHPDFEPGPFTRQAIAYFRRLPAGSLPPAELRLVQDLTTQLGATLREEDPPRP